MRRKKHNHGEAKGFVMGAVVAGIAGYTTGLLTSPRSGKQNRLKVKRVAKKSKKATEKELRHLHKELTDVVTTSKTATKNMTQKAQGEYGLLIERAKNSRESVKEVIGAIKEGKAKDKDLDKAVKDAQNAVLHAKDFIIKKK